MEPITGILRLKKGREKPVANRHPWVFSGAIERVEGEPEPGDLVAVHDHRGEFLAAGTYNPYSQIRARLLSLDPNQAVDEAFWHGNLQRAIDGRNALPLEPQTNAYRLVNAEAPLRLLWPTFRWSAPMPPRPRVASSGIHRPSTYTSVHMW